MPRLKLVAGAIGNEKWNEPFLGKLDGFVGVIPFLIPWPTKRTSKFGVVTLNGNQEENQSPFWGFPILKKRHPQVQQGLVGRSVSGFFWFNKG